MEENAGHLFDTTRGNVSPPIFLPHFFARVACFWQIRMRISSFPVDRWFRTIHTQPVNISPLKKILCRDVDTAFVFLSSPTFFFFVSAPQNIPLTIQIFVLANFLLYIPRSTRILPPLNGLLYLQNMRNDKSDIWKYIFLDIACIFSSPDFFVLHGSNGNWRKF